MLFTTSPIGVPFSCILNFAMSTGTVGLISLMCLLSSILITFFRQLTMCRICLGIPIVGSLLSLVLFSAKNVYFSY